VSDAVDAALVIVAFFVGAIPFGVLISRSFYQRDIRAEGSGNIGAANALRTLGKRGAVAVLVLDAFKGALPTVAGFGLGGVELGCAAGLAAVVGHCFSPFLGFRGGKGVATNFGVVSALVWHAGVTFALVWLGVAIVTRYASVASLAASIAMAPYLGSVLGLAGTVYGILSSMLIFFMHRGNIARLRAGSEPTLSLTRGQR
jgi:glycerol-3-phosphate acyltransferase PlsY